MNVSWRDAEPYRLLFPLGAALGVVGVSLWPLFVFKAMQIYPGIPHARLMIEGFTACFIFGFLGTALPEMLLAPRFRLPEILSWGGGLLAACVLHLVHKQMIGDFVFAGTLLLFFACAAPRILKRKDPPPPGLFTVFMGLLCAFAGSVIQAVNLITALPDFLFTLSRLLLDQAFVLLPIMGIGAFILPVFIGYPRRQSVAVMNQHPHGWAREAAFIASYAAAFILGLVIESLGLVRFGALIRGMTVVIFLARQLPVHRRQQSPGTMAWVTRLALMALPFAFFFIAAWPKTPLSWIHMFYISGVGMLIAAVATRVIVAHGGFRIMFGARWVRLWVIFTLITLAMITRVAADHVPAAAFIHYAYAGLLWISGMGLWLFTMAPFLRARDEAH